MRGSLTMDELGKLSMQELDAIFSNEGRPPVLAKLDGHLEGVSLENAVVPLGPVQDTINLVANSTWLGKTFISLSPTTGKGFNRIKIGAEFQTAHFVAEMAPGRDDGKPSLHLNYDVEDNLHTLRTLRDELREVADGIYLGKAYFQLGPFEHALFYFGVTTAR